MMQMTPHPLLLVLLLVSLHIGMGSSFHFSPEATLKNKHNAAQSQWGEDIFLFENYFYGMVDGTVIESGALDGMFLSNSLMFEKLLGWHSLLIEANPQNYKKLKVAPRSNATKIHAALCDADTKQTLHYVILEGRRNDRAIAGLYEFMPESHKKRYFGPVEEYLSTQASATIDATALNAAKLVNAKGSIYKAYAVNCLPMRHILEQEHITHVNLWALDVEGAEVSALRSHDFDRVPVDVLLIEAEVATCTKKGGCVFPHDPSAPHCVEIKEYLETTEKGYNCSVLFMGSLVCVHKSFIPSVKPPRSA